MRWGGMRRRETCRFDAREIRRPLVLDREASGTVATIMVIVFAILGAAVFVTASCNGEPPVERMERKGCR